MFKVIGTDTYLGEISKWTKADREVAEKIPEKLSLDPYLCDPLGYRFFRERRIREKRVYFLVYEDLQLVLLIATSGKKDQQSKINYIKHHFDDFRKLAEKISTQAS